MADKVRSAAKGALAGALATAPMSAVMLGADRLGLMGRQPPEVIIQKALDAANREPRRRTVKPTAAAAHVGFGAAAGAAFALLESDEDALPRSIAKGALFGIGLYAASYAGWIPALDILPRPGHDRKGRQPAMAVAHVVYGTALALLLAMGDER